MFGNLSDTSKFMFFFYIISRGNHSDVVRNTNWQTS